MTVKGNIKGALSGFCQTMLIFKSTKTNTAIPQQNLAPSLSFKCHAHRPVAKRLMHMAHLSVNTLGVSKSSSDWLNSTGFLGDVCVAFFNVPPGNKDAVTPNPPPRKKKSIGIVYNRDDKCSSWSNKRWILKRMRNI